MLDELSTQKWISC